ncbi:MAG: heavy-metal-associated domain-containing protein [Nitrospiraceae bacterium]|nr:MAG: heavy-metal-associated domain-containing protein [Nitrospiraceae bacterium]
MAALSLRVGHVYCYSCVEGAGAFIRKMKGVHSVSVKNNDSVVVEYDPASLDMDEEQFRKIVRENIERLGFRIRDY